MLFPFGAKVQKNADLLEFSLENMHEESLANANHEAVPILDRLKGARALVGTRRACVNEAEKFVDAAGFS